MDTTRSDTITYQPGDTTRGWQLGPDGIWRRVPRWRLRLTVAAVLAVALLLALIIKPAVAALGVLLLAYSLPSIIAVGRAKDSAGGVVAVNLLVGWTGIGWLAALIWSCS